MSRWKYAAPAAAILFVAGCAGDTGNVLAPPAVLAATLSGGGPEIPLHTDSTSVASDPGTLQQPGPDRILAASTEVGDNSMPSPNMAQR